MSLGQVAAWVAALIVCAAPIAAASQLRLTPAEIAALAKGGAGAGTSGVAGLQTTVL
ncbi:hypothetical protein [Mesorhizobium amorphae]|uniref:hypothetical protein n=1 Tax=Mesorhizobium amorphae TaxID=71433 RepID=UPI001AEF20BA|nr:hypothetical protein [Mesorhizobium amorphae]